MKKILACISIILFLVAFNACSQSEDEPNLNYDTTNTNDWMGESFTILQGSTKENPFYYIQDTLLADSALLRMETVAQSHNCDIQLKFGGSDDAMRNYLADCLAVGDSPADIVFALPTQINQYANAGGFVDFEELFHIIDIYDETKWGTPNIWEFTIYKGVLCGVTPISWLQKEPPVYYPIVFNADITRAFGYSDLREFYETNTWTREKMLEVIVNCTDNTLTSPIKGMSACLMHFIRSALLNNGTQFAVFNDDVTEYSCGWNSPAGIEALTWVKDVADNYSEYIYEFTNLSYHHWEYQNPFNNGEAALLLTRSITIFDEIAFNVENMGILPFPIGPYGEEGKWSGFFEAAYTVSIPIFVKEVEACAVLINEIFAPLDQYPTKDDIIDYYNSNVFSDTRDYAILDIMTQNCKYSFYPDGGDNVLYGLFNNILSMSPTEILESYGNASDDCIINQMIPSILTVRRLTGDESYN